MKNLDYIIIFLFGMLLGFGIIAAVKNAQRDRSCKELKIYYPEVRVTFCKYKNL